jgi:hypothetical protein
MSGHTFRPELRAQDCLDWLTREDVARMSLQAFEMARNASRQPVGQRFVVDGQAWSSRDQFAEDLAFVFELQIKNEAHRLGIDRGEFLQQAATLQRWLRKSDRAIPSGEDNPEVSTTHPEALQ